MDVRTLRHAAGRRSLPSRLTLIRLLAWTALSLPCARHAAASGQTVAFEDLGGDRCFMFSRLTSPAKGAAGLVIDTEADFSGLFDPKILRQTCFGTSLFTLILKVDFAAKTVLGLWTVGGCADTGFTRSVSRDDAARSVTYSVSPVGVPKACMGPGPQSLNLIAIPKLPPGYHVVFLNSRH